MSDYEDNSSGDEEEAISFLKGRDAFIFVVDALMFKDQAHFQEAFTLIRESFLTGIISYPKQLIAVVFHNTKYSPKPKDMWGMDDIVVQENQCIFMPLKSLSKDSIGYYQEFCNNDYFDFEQTYGCEEGSFVNTIRLCCNMFHNCRPRPGSETIVYFTNAETPHPIQSDAYHKAILKANDLRDINVDFEVIPMEDDFNYDPFFKEFICLVKGIDMDTFEAESAENKQEMFKSHQLSLNLKNRCISHFKWILGDGFDLSVGYYNLYSKGAFPKAVKLFREDNSIIDVKRVKELKCLDELGESEDTRMLLPGEETSVLKCSGEDTVISADGVAKLKTPLAPSMQLLGFINNSNTFSYDTYVKPSGFLYPSEFQITGSTKLFKAIWQKCLEMDKSALCVLSKKRKSYPNFVLLKPTRNGIEGSLKTHDGFAVIYLPSFDNIRNIDVGDWKGEDPSEDQISFFKQVVKKLRVSFDPLSKSLTDPALDDLNAKIIALAFDLETENLASGLNPNLEEQDERMNFSVEEMIDLFGEEDTTTTKRSGSSTAGGNAIKKAKVSDSDINEDMIVEMANKNALGGLSVNQLKLYLQNKGESGLSKLTKPGLIQKIMNLHI